MRYTQTLAAMALGVALAAPAAYGQMFKQPDQKIDNADAAAMKQLAQANLNKIESGKAAVQKAHAKIEEHLQLAQRVASQHGAAVGGTSK